MQRQERRQEHLEQAQAYDWLQYRRTEISIRLNQLQQLPPQQQQQQQLDNAFNFVFPRFRNIVRRLRLVNDPAAVIRLAFTLLALSDLPPEVNRVRIVRGFLGPPFPAIAAMVDADDQDHHVPEALVGNEGWRRLGTHVHILFRALWSWAVVAAPLIKQHKASQEQKSHQKICMHETEWDLALCEL